MAKRNFLNKVFFWRQLPSVRIYLVLAVFIVAAILLFVQTFRIAILEGDKWRDIAKEDFVRYEDVPALRGNIVSDDGSLLAGSIDKYDIHFDLQVNGLTKKVFEENVDSLAYCLSKYVNNKYTPGGQLRRLLEARANGARYFTIAKNVSHEKKNQISKFPIFSRGRHGGGLIVERVLKREMPFNLLAKRTIGYSSREGANDVGIEGAFDNFLAGTDGQRLTLRVSEKTRIPINESAEIQPEDGSNVRTTLDIGMQDVAENALMSALKHHDAQSGSVIVMDVNTGQIKALANLEKTEGGYWETFNYGVGTNIEPGSVLKLAPVMALLEDGIVDIHDNIPIYNGKTTFYGEEMVDSSVKSHDIDSTSLLNAFAMSSNVGIGVQKSFGPTVLNASIASARTIDKAQQLLAEVVKSGTARKLKSPKYSFSGKTGTAQINYKNQRKRSKKKVGHRSSFVGYFPSKQPKYTCIVVITDPKQNGIYGADVAGPVFREVMDNAFFLKPELHLALNKYKKPKLENKDLPSSFAGNIEDIKLVLNTLKVPYIVNSEDEMMTTSVVRNDSIFLIDRPKGDNLIPNVVGMGVRDALYVLENEGMQVKFNGKGKVKKQSIRPGTRIAGQTIHLTLG